MDKQELGKTLVEMIEAYEKTKREVIGWESSVDETGAVHTEAVLVKDDVAVTISWNTNGKSHAVEVTRTAWNLSDEEERRRWLNVVTSSLLRKSL